MSKPIIFWGASGHAKVLAEFMGALDYELVATFDNRPGTPPPFPDVPLFIGMEGLARWQKQFNGGKAYSLVAIGGPHGRDRLELQERLEQAGIDPIVAIHPRAFVARDVVLGKGCQVLAQASVCAGSRLGEACIVNTSASVDHQCELGRGVHVAPGARLAGYVTAGDYSMIALGAIVLPRLNIGRDAIVGAGAVVTRDVAERTVVFGNPARVRRINPGP
jgi:sugar O-acyltransferase (sialic acid O-acetyltransferase NeuD family)